MKASKKKKQNYGRLLALQYALAPCQLTLKVVSESCVTWTTSVSILVFQGLSVLDLGPMYATDRQTSDVTPHYLGRGAFDF